MRTVRCISLWQPWASALFVTAPEQGMMIKPIETRHWPTKFRGELAIHAAQKTSLELRAFFEEKLRDRKWSFEILRSGINSYNDLPLGAIIGTVEMVDCLPTAGPGPDQESANEERFERYCAHGYWPASGEWGDFSPGRYGWCFQNAKLLTFPIPYKGKQGFFNVEIPQ